MKPTEAGTDRYKPEIQREKTPPIRAKGRLSSTRPASLKESKVEKSKKKIRPIVRGTMMPSRFIALC